MYCIFTRRRVICVAFTAALIFIIALTFIKTYNSGIDGSSEKARLIFIEQLGFKVGECREREVILPYEPDDIYSEYEALQKYAGFDLSIYRGSKVMLYTYFDAEYPGYLSDAQLNLIVYRGRIIGGDISEADTNGKMLPLKKITD